MPIHHFVCWNVNGIRAILKKEFMNNIKAMAPDALCLQETKAGEDEAPEALKVMQGYNVFTNFSKRRKGYFGTAIIFRMEPVNVTYDIGMERFDQEGEVVTAE